MMEIEKCQRHDVPLRNRKDKKGKYCPVCMQSPKDTQHKPVYRGK